MFTSSITCAVASVEVYIASLVIRESIERSDSIEGWDVRIFEHHHPVAEVPAATCHAGTAHRYLHVTEEIAFHIMLAMHLLHGLPPLAFQPVGEQQRAPCVVFGDAGGLPSRVVLRGQSIRGYHALRVGDLLHGEGLFC